VAVASPPHQSPSEAALARYRAAMRRSRIVYFTVVGVLVAALVTWAAVTWSRGEAAHATLHTFAPAPPTLHLATPGSQPTEAWRTTDHLAIGTPQWGGTVITYSKHSVGGRDARTGNPTWTYTRTDRSVCVAAQISGASNGTTIAVYSRAGNCDELGAFDSATGRRLWTRTLDMDGMPVNGRPMYQITAGTFLVATSSVIYAIDPSSGFNRWTYQRYGCAIEHVVLGIDGALISQNCSSAVRCKGVKFCGQGPQLLLRNPTDARGDDSKPNADLIKWNRFGDDSVPVSADQVITSVGPLGRTLYVHDATSGDRLHQLKLHPVRSALGGVSATATDGAEIVWLSGVTYAVRADRATPVWRSDTLAAPTVISAENATSIALSSARITAVTSAGVAILDGSTGTVAQTVQLPGAAAGVPVVPLGAGFLVASAGGTVAYR
jgi:outer membrane protein assembly factor BamB